MSIKSVEVETNIQNVAGVSTMEDVARTAGVSLMTVSRILNGKSQNSPHRERVLQVVRDLGFKLNPDASRLAAGYNHNTIGLFTIGLDLGVGTRKLGIIQRLLADHGFRVPIYAYGGHLDADHQGEAMQDLRLQQPRAIVCGTNGLEAKTLNQLRLFREQGGLLICYGTERVDLDCDQVIVDIDEQMYQMTRHLISYGHQKIGLAMHNATPLPNDPFLMGFQRALQESDLRFRSDWMFGGENTGQRSLGVLTTNDNQDVFYRGLYAEAGEIIARQIAKLAECPTALCIVNDDTASAFVNEAARRGIKVPQDISVVSHDDLPQARLCSVPLSAMSYPVEPMARLIVEMTLSRLKGQYTGPARYEIVRGELTERESVASLP